MLIFHVPLPYDLNDSLEQGGLLFGPPGEVRLVTGPLPGDDRGERHLTMNDPGHLAAAAQAEARGWGYLGYWHSHPAGTPQDPSEVDLADWHAAVETIGAPYLDFPIITGGVLRAWRLHQSGELEEVSWTSIP